ncbi:MAG: M23 family metallopeptidase [Sheuella sp.]|jgi:murein DD-endopeptidase MepM/ murein hydrolase activator NlpD|nr:M23 family metallopeptidase [Sheuella sp.]
MKLIIMPSRPGQQEILSLSAGWLIVAVVILLAASMAAGAGIQRLIWAAQPETQPLRIVSPQSLPGSGPDHQVMQALATRVGELQASVVKLDGLGRRVAQVAGLPDSNVAIVGDLPEATIVLDDVFAPNEAVVDKSPTSELERQINIIQASLTRQDDYFSLLDLKLTQQAANIAKLPTAMPIESYPYLSSSYGWRRNPFNGQVSRHEGLDFSAPPGTPIRAATGGVVRTVTVHSGYGNMVEIDHGEGLVTRYAHAKVILVKEGELVTRGQMIARVGSTGLSTGPHLHFEVRRDDKALDPRVFLAGQPLITPSPSIQSVATSPSVTWRPRLR